MAISRTMKKNPVKTVLPTRGRKSGTPVRRVRSGDLTAAAKSALVAKRATAAKHAKAIEVVTRALAADGLTVAAKLDLLDRRAAGYIARGDLDRAAADANAMLELARRARKSALMAKARKRHTAVQKRGAPTSGGAGKPAGVAGKAVGKAMVKAAGNAANASGGRATALPLRASPADESQRLRSETAQRNAELAVINSVQEGLASKLEIQAIHDLVGNKVREIFDADVVGISLFDKTPHSG